MKKKLLRISFLLAIFASLNAHAQKNFAPSQPRVLTLEQSTNNNQFIFPEIDKFDGSYQFIVKQKRDFVLTTETFQLIDKSRKESEDVIIYLNEGLDVFIPSKEKIGNKDFSPFSNTYILK